MGILFLDTTHGSDAKDGKQSLSLAAAVSGIVATAPLRTIGEMIILEKAAYDFSAWVGKVVYLEDVSIPTQTAYVLMTTGSVGSGTGTIWGQPSDLDTEVVPTGPTIKTGTGPHATIAHVLSVRAAGDWVATVGADGVCTIEPIAELVALALKVRLETITAANGYTMDIGTVHRPTSLAWPVPDNLHLIIDEPTDRLADESSTMQEHHAAEFDLYLMIRVSESSTVPLATLGKRFHAAVRKCLLADVTLGGVTWDIEIGDLEAVESPEPIAAFRLAVVAKYRHADTDPYPA